MTASVRAQDDRNGTAEELFAADLAQLDEIEEALARAHERVEKVDLMVRRVAPRDVNPTAEQAWLLTYFAHNCRLLGEATIENAKSVESRTDMLYVGSRGTPA